MEQTVQQTENGLLLTREEAMKSLRLKSSHFSKVVNGKIKGLPRLPAVLIGRRQLFKPQSLQQWIQEVEERGCRQVH
jgi:hypothetical protein